MQAVADIQESRVAFNSVALSRNMAGPDNQRVTMRGVSANRRENDEMKKMAEFTRAVADREDRDAFRELFTFYAPRLKAFLIKNGATPGDAEEVMQEAMTLVWRKAEQFDSAKASANDLDLHYRSQPSHRPYTSGETPRTGPGRPIFTSVSEQPDGEQVFSRTERETLVRKYLETLPADQLQVVQKAFYEEMTHQEIAAELDMPLGTVNVRIRIAMRRLRDQLDRAEL